MLPLKWFWGVRAENLQYFENFINKFNQKCTPRTLFLPYFDTVPNRPYVLFCFTNDLHKYCT